MNIHETGVRAAQNVAQHKKKLRSLTAGANKRDKRD